MQKTFPATYPNRSIRRALRQGKQLPTEWRIFFAQNPEYAELVRTNRMS